MPCDLMGKKNKTSAKSVESQYSLAASFHRNGKLQQAIESYLRVVEADPKHIDALKELGLVLRSVGRSHDALKYVVQAVMLEPLNGELLGDLGETWQSAGHLPKAIAAYQKALELKPGLSRVLYSLGCAQIESGEFVPARASFEEALIAEPNWLEARHNLGRALYEMGEVSAAFSQFERCAGLTERKESERARAMAAVVVPGVPEVNNEKILAIRRRWAETDLSLPQDVVNPGVRSTSDGGRLRVGYVSSFFGGANWMKPVWGLINQHDREQFDIHLFSDAESTTFSSIEYAYRRHGSDEFHNVFGSSNDQVARLIRKCRIDILVDLNGYSKAQRLDLFNLRPAPVIVGWFNLYGTSGLRSFDYLIGDRHVLPVEEELFYSEKIRRVSGSWLTFEPLRNAPDVCGAPCLADGAGITFGSAASQYKITSDVVKGWSRILTESPSSLLLLKNKHLASATSREFVHSLFENNGISRDRISLEGSEPYLQFLGFYNRIDVALETWPYGGATTTTDALWQGVPVIAFDGDRWASRLSVSLLREAGLSEFAKTNLEEYISFAVDLGTSAASREKLADLRSGMRSRLKSSSVCDTGLFARDIEELYKSMSRDHLG